MDVEFHYYMTYLIAARAGFPPGDAFTLAHACQYVDDNDFLFTICKGTKDEYRNYISQTMDILKPKPKLMRIYPLFHFCPGNIETSCADRRDGKLHRLNTTPDSRNANEIFDRALATGSLHRIGIAAHTFSDTWAHQNFVGYFDAFNGMHGVLESVSPNIGHADAGHNPDWPALIWQDKRLIANRVDNKTRFLDAAERLFEKFCTSPLASPARRGDQKGLRKDLDLAIGEIDQGNESSQARIQRYIELSGATPYGGTKLDPYDMDRWFLGAVGERVHGLRDRKNNVLNRWDPFTDTYTWQSVSNYRTTDWFLFQEAVKSHQNDAWSVLEETTFSHMQLEEL